MRVEPFKPASTTSLACSTSSDRVQIVGIIGTPLMQVRLYNSGSVTVFVKFGGASVTAAVTDLPIPAGTVEVLSCKGYGSTHITYIAGITASSTATLYITSGEGV